ncbi:hypothetical protein [Aurantibacter sp.]|uniref:hypothetical protein n=1 Tax=Aurantibacter sp. TaxID=2807103 RepID=UPI003263A288
MSRFLKYLKFLSSATNQHGVHSPFVYNYITKCIYSDKLYKKAKTLDVLLKSIIYFNYKFINVVDNALVTDLIHEKIKECQFDNTVTDLTYVDEISIELINTFFSNEKTHNDSMLIINDIYKNEGSINLWQHLINTELATVTIDFFYCGVVFKRKEQVKEHFKIRL